MLLIFFAAIPGGILTFSCTYMCGCSRFVFVGEDGHMRLHCCGKAVTGIGKIMDNGHVMIAFFKNIQNNLLEIGIKILAARSYKFSHHASVVRGQYYYPKIQQTKIAVLKI